MRGSGWMVACMAWAAAAPVAAQAPAVRATFTGRSHFQFSTTSVDAAEAGATAPIPQSTFETRRVRIGVDVHVGEWIRGRIEPEFTLGELSLKQAWMSFMVDSSFTVRAGQVKKPFGLINLSSSGELPVIERGLRIRGIDEALTVANGAAYSTLRGDVLIGEQHTLLDAQAYLGYDQGVEAEGRIGPVSFIAGLYNGSGPDTRDENDDKSIAARVTIEPVDHLVIGGAFSRRELNWPVGADFEKRSGNAFALDAELGGFRRGVWLLGEITTGENLVSGERFMGAHFIGALYHPTGSTRVQGWEPAFRMSWGDPDDSVDGDAGVLVTPGVNLYFVGRNRFMLNWDLYLPQADGVDAQHGLRAQFNLHF